MRVRRRELKAADADAAHSAARAWADAGGPAPAIAAIYSPQGAELDAWPLAAVLRLAGAKIALPVAVAPDKALEFREARESDPMEVDAAGVLAPREGAAALRPDLLITPLLAFDHSGNRLGQGGGFYDRTITSLRASSVLTVLGLGYAGQEVDHLPMEAHDARLDGVITEAGVLLFDGAD